MASLPSTLSSIVLCVLIPFTLAWEHTCPKANASLGCYPDNQCKTCDNPLCHFCQCIGSSCSDTCGERDCVTCIPGYQINPIRNYGTGECVPITTETTINLESAQDSITIDSYNNSLSGDHIIIIIILAVSIGILICCVIIIPIMYCMYYRGVKNGIKKAMEAAVSNAQKTVVVEVMGNKASSGDITISPHVHIHSPHGMSGAANDEEETVSLNDGGNIDTETGLARCEGIDLAIKSVSSINQNEDGNVAGMPATYNFIKSPNLKKISMSIVSEDSSDSSDKSNEGMYDKERRTQGRMNL